MNPLVKLDSYDEEVVKICPNGTLGEVVELGGLFIGLPEEPSSGTCGTQ